MLDANRFQNDKQAILQTDPLPKREKIQDMKLTAEQLARMSQRRANETQQLVGAKDHHRSSSDQKAAESKPKKKKGKSKKQTEAIDEDIVQEAPPKKPKKSKGRKKSLKKGENPEATQIKLIKQLPVSTTSEKQPTNIPISIKAPAPVRQSKEITETICQLCYTIVANQKEFYAHEMRCLSREMMCFDCKQSIPQVLYDAHQQCCIAYNERKQGQTSMKSLYDTTKMLMEYCVCQVCKPVVVPPIPPPILQSSVIPKSPEYVLRPLSLNSNRDPQSLIVSQRIMQSQAFRNAYISQILPPTTIVRSNTESSLIHSSDRPVPPMPIIPEHQPSNRSVPSISVPRECPLIKYYKTSPPIVNYEVYKNVRQKSLSRQRILNNLPRRLYMPRQNEVDDCSICCAKMRLQDQVIELKCKHMLHISCISEWLMKDDRCPLCMLKAI